MFDHTVLLTHKLRHVSLPSPYGIITGSTLVELLNNRTKVIVLWKQEFLYECNDSYGPEKCIIDNLLN